MATEKKGGTGIRYDDFVKSVRPDPGATEQLVLLHGYVGASVSDDKIRLYSDASLNEYADIAKADIVYSMANEDDPLGGSRIWVKQSANVNYADAAQGYAQGDMYNSYMNDMYTPGSQTMGAGAATLTCTIGQLTNTTVCRPSRFVCPTPLTRLIICNLPRTRVGCPPPITVGACPQPSWVDACPSQWGCTIQTGTTVINPGTGGAQFAGDYTGGDVYNDYLQNNYQPGTENFGPGAATSPQVCLQQITNTGCYSLPVHCRITNPILCRQTTPIICRITRQSPWCPVTCALGTIRPTTIPSIACYTAGCATDFTRVQTTVQTIGATVAGGGQFAGDYTGGDVYNDYMQNTYSPGMENFGPSPVTSPQVCLQPVSVNINCVSRQIVCASSPIICISRPVWRCITRNNMMSICRPCWPTTLRTTAGPSAVDGCPSTPGGCMTDITKTFPTETYNPGGGFYDYGY